MRWWFRAEPQTVSRTVFGPHPIQIARQIEAVYSLDVSARADPMVRREAASGLNGASFRGYGIGQDFRRTYGFQPAMARVRQSSLPSTAGQSMPASSMLDLLGSTVG